MIWGFLVTLALLSAGGLGAAGQQTGRTPPQVIPSVAGGDLFGF